MSCWWLLKLLFLIWSSPLCFRLIQITAFYTGEPRLSLRHLKYTNQKLIHHLFPKPDLPPLFFISRSSTTLHLVTHTKKKRVMLTFPLYPIHSHNHSFFNSFLHTRITVVFADIYNLLSNIKHQPPWLQIHPTYTAIWGAYKNGNLIRSLLVLYSSKILHCHKKNLHASWSISLMVFSARKMT